MWPFSQYLYFYNLSIWPRHLHKTNIDFCSSTTPNSRKHVACISEYFHTTHCHVQNTQGNIQLIERPNKIHGFFVPFSLQSRAWLLRLQKEKCQHDMEAHFQPKSSPSLFQPTLQAPQPTRWQRDTSWSSLGSTGTWSKKGSHSPERPQSAQDTNSSGRPLFLFILEPPKQKSQ